MTKEIAEEIEWRPELSAERLARVERHMERFARAGSLFRSIRERLGLTQVEAALRLGTTQANVSKLEKRPTADLAQLSKLAANSRYKVVLVLRSETEQEKDLEFALT
ncbi:helix-turn-helix domain-containing protein [Sphingomonas bacterium]|uniref:helix-turn-helix domain-containing protein n=1 Tax=Sphingomonas bacterium TaxID=1895847 RepID=UPI0015761935|nr:helix-turn-helix domain-containing protein [Sphingomonas bacterium]